MDYKNVIVVEKRNIKILYIKAWDTRLHSFWLWSFSKFHAFDIDIFQDV